MRQWAEEEAAQLKKVFIDFSELKIEDLDKILQDPGHYFVFVDVRITSLDPVDLQGLLRERCAAGTQSSYVVYKPLAMAVLLNACAGVLFLDEFLNESRPHMQAATYRIVRDRKLGDTALNPGVLVIAASNELEHSSLSSALPTPLRDRFDWVTVDTPSLDEWSAYMDAKYCGRWDRRILYYLKSRPGEFLTNFMDSTEDNGITPPATPRGWTHVALEFWEISDMLKAGGIKQKEAEDLMLSVASGKLGTAGEVFMAYMRADIPPFDELVRNPSVIKDFKIEQKWLAAVKVAEGMRESDEKLEAGLAFIDYIASSDDREFLTSLFFQLPTPVRMKIYEKRKDNAALIEVLSKTGAAVFGT